MTSYSKKIGLVAGWMDGFGGLRVCGGWVVLLAVGRDRLEMRGTCWPLANRGGGGQVGLDCWVGGSKGGWADRAGWIGWRGGVGRWA